MDTTPQPSQPPAQPQPVSKTRNANMKGKMIMILLALLFFVVGAAAGWYYRDMQAKDDLDAQKAKTTTLESKNAKLTSDLAAAKKAAGAAAPVSAGVRPSQATLDNIAASISSGNTAALEGYSASTVSVIIAASEGVGNRTPAQMVSDVAYVKNGTEPWNFNLPTATISGYQAGDYAQYFPSTAYVGKSGNGYVISFQFDSAGKIKGVFMAAPGVL